MSEKRLNNTILNYVAECPDIFDSLTGSEMVREVEQYVSQP